MDENFNKYRPMVPQSKKWRAKSAEQPVGPVEPLQPTGPTGAGDRSDRQVQPVRPVEPAVEQTAEVATSAPCEDVPAVPAASECSNMEINVVHFSEDYYAISEQDTAHLDFGPREAVFQKPKESDNHLKALYMR